MKKTVNLSLRIPETLDRLIEKRAAKDGVPKSDIIRRALIRYFVEEQSSAAKDPEPAGLQDKRKTNRGTPPQGGA